MTMPARVCIDDVIQIVRAQVDAVRPDCPAWLALGSETEPIPAAAERYSQNHQLPGVIICRHAWRMPDQDVCQNRPGVTLVRSDAALPQILADLGGGGVQLLFLSAENATKHNLQFSRSGQTIQPPPQAVVLQLPHQAWRRGLVLTRPIERRLAREGYAFLAQQDRELLFSYQETNRRKSAPGGEAPAKPVLTIQTFDFWDTLITRWHPDPKVVFDVVGEQAGLLGFRQKRVDAERQARRAHPAYTLDHIYAALVERGDIPSHQRAAIQALELEVEQQFARPIQANLDRINAGDVVISDMYLSADDMRTIARPFINLDRHPFVVSPHGKQRGTIWKELSKAGIEARHLGDNYMADYVHAARLQHKTALVREHHYSDLERRFADEGLVALANLIRLQRLAIPQHGRRQGYPAGAEEALLTVQKRFNLPLLFLTALEIRRLARQADGPTHLLFCSRDCCYLHGIFKCMEKAKPLTQTCEPPREIHHHYFLTSRKAKRKASQGYKDYTQSLLTGKGAPRPLIIDVQGSGRSSHQFFTHELQQPIEQLFIYTGEGNLEAYNARSLLDRALVRKLMPRSCDLLEVLNYSSDRSTLDCHTLPGLGHIPEFECENRTSSILRTGKLFEVFYQQVNDLMDSPGFRYLFANWDDNHYKPTHFNLLETIDGIQDLRLLRELTLEQHRRN
jgi:hypothetical protein